MAGQSFSSRVQGFWQRVTEGLELSELWSQFRADAQSSYRLYSRDVNSSQVSGYRGLRRFFRLVGQFFWAVLEKLTPARRVLLLLALAMLLLPVATWTQGGGRGEETVSSPDFHFMGGALMFALLIMEVGDRVVMKRDLQIAKEIQGWLLPAAPPAISGLEIAFATRPANTVAGDYYDVFARTGSSAAGETFLIAIADVAGKSVPAALLMASFQASLKTLSAMPGSLTELAARLNGYAATNSQNGRRFTTAVIAEYDPPSRRLEYVNAGHNSPILLRKSGQLDRLQTGGVPFGILAGASYQSAQLILEPGDWLAFFTDGVPEAENLAQQQYSEERLVTMLRWGAAMPASMLLGEILADIDRFVQKAPQHDDITCMLLRVV